MLDKKVLKKFAKVVKTFSKVSGLSTQEAIDVVLPGVMKLVEQELKASIK